MSEDPFGIVVSPSSVVVSPAELLMNFINQYADEQVVPSGAVVGGADDRQQQSGVVAIMDAGNTKNELYAPLLHKRCQLRCMGPTLSEADRIGSYVYRLLHDQKWMVMGDSAGAEWFVHTIYCTTGPSHHLDSSETYEALLFANITVGSEPVFQPDPEA